MKSDVHSLEVKNLFVSPGHDFKGRHGESRREHDIEDREEVELVAGSGIVGDRYFNYKPDYKGQLTFFDEAVWQEICEKFALPELEVSTFRRNAVVSGLDLNELIGQRFSIGELEFTGSEEAKPCYWMDEACKPGVEEFLRGKGGLRCRIVKGGTLAKGICELRVLGQSQ
ncbi:MAG: MOSC domain-containing protein [Roseibacillus sp.]